jgi:DNA-binding GntR family transcriptional regulator
MSDLTRYKLLAKHRTSAAAKLLYCYLLDLSGNYHRNTAVSVRTISRDVGISRSTVRRNLHRLGQLGVLGISPRYTDDGGRLSNEYTLR